MKKITFILLLFSTINSGCNAENNDKTVKNNIASTKEANNTIQPKISLNCQGFELDHDDYLLCNYWHKSNRLNKNIDLKNFTKYYEINNVHDLTPSDYAFHATTQLAFNNTKYNAYIYPNSRITLQNPNKKLTSEITGKLENETTEYICQNLKCKDMFLWDYSDEGIAGKYPKIEEKTRLQRTSLLENLNEKTDKKTVENTQIKDKLIAKIYFPNSSGANKQYVYRSVSTISPLKDSIKAYLDGVTIEESKQGFSPNTLGIRTFNAKIKNHTAYIDFRSEKLDIKSPENVIDFDYNITKTAEQFPSIKNVEICINGISNYQTAFFANEPEEKCDF